MPSRPTRPARPKTFKVKTSELALSPNGFVIVSEELRKVLEGINVADIPILSAHNDGCTNGKCGANTDTNSSCTNTECS